MDDSALLRYSRHLLLDAIGIEGQEKINQARVLMIGAGGLAAGAAPYLAAAGVGTLTIIDDDIVEWHNLQRQIAFDESQVGQPKAAALAKRLLAINSRIHVQPLCLRADAAFLHQNLNQYDVVLDCCDNFATRHAINRTAWQQGIPLVSGAVTRFSGQLAVYDFRRRDLACYACFNPEESGNDGACAVFGVFAPMVGIIGAMQAAEALKLITNIGNDWGNRLLCFDALSATWQSFAIPKNPHCPVCAQTLPTKA